MRSTLTGQVYRNHQGLGTYGGLRTHRGLGTGVRGKYEFRVIYYIIVQVSSSLQRCAETPM